MIADHRNIEIRVGDTIAYPGRHSSSLWMNTAKVLSVHEQVGREGSYLRARLPENNRVVKITVLHNVVVLDRPVGRTLTSQLTGVEKATIKEVRANGGLITAVRLVRSLVDCSLLDAKRYVEGL